jgi:hypothetical protein
LSKSSPFRTGFSIGSPSPALSGFAAHQSTGLRRHPGWEVEFDRKQKENIVNGIAPREGARFAIYEKNMPDRSRQRIFGHATGLVQLIAPSLASRRT